MLYERLEERITVVRVIRVVHILEFPAVEVLGGEGETDWRVAHPLGETHLDVPWHFLSLVVKGFQLGADIFQDESIGKLGLRIIIAEARVETESDRRVVRQGGIEKFHRQAGTPAFAQVAGIKPLQADVLGGELTQLGVVGRCLLDIPIREKGGANTPSALFAMRFREKGTSGVDVGDVVQVVQVDRPVHLRTQQTGIVEDQRGIVLHQRNGVTTHRARAVGVGQAEEAECLVACLRPAAQGDQPQAYCDDTFSHNR